MILVHSHHLGKPLLSPALFLICKIKTTCVVLISVFGNLNDDVDDESVVVGVVCVGHLPLSSALFLGP